MNDAEQYFSDLQNLATTQDKAKFRALALTFHSTLQRLPALKQELEVMLKSTEALDYEALLQRVEPVLEQASDWLLDVDLLPDELANEKSIQDCVTKFSKLMRLSTINQLIQQFEQELQKIPKGQRIGKFVVQEGIAIDTTTALTWLRFAHGQQWMSGSVVGESITVTWEKALTVASAFNAQGGYAEFTDWRLPTIDELKTLIDKFKGREGNYIDAEVFFNNVRDNCWRYWSSSHGTNSSNGVQIVNFSYGKDGSNYNKNSSGAIRLVRGG